MIDLPGGAPYSNGVRENPQGSIVYLDPESEQTCGPDDACAHLPCKLQHAQLARVSQLTREIKRTQSRGLRQENTRPLIASAEEALGHVMHSTEGRARRLLFLGPGAGLEIDQAKALIDDAVITTNALTPMNPAVRLQQDFSSLRANLWSAVKAKGTEVERIAFSWMRDAQSMSPDFALNMDRALGTNVFAQEPDAPRQFIGDLTQLVTRLEEIPPQDLLYEQYGPLTKILQGRPSETTMRTLRTILGKLIQEESLLVIGGATEVVRTRLAAILPSFAFAQSASGGWVGFDRDGPHASIYDEEPSLVNA